MPEEQWLNESVFTISSLLTSAECQEYIRLSEEIGYEDALLTSPQGNVRRTDIRNNQRVMFQNEEIARFLWERIEEFVPYEIEGRSAAGVNELLRFYRYDPGQWFNWHQDISFERDSGEKSFYTFLVYLNDDFEGGETSFEDSYSEESFDEFSVSPRTGMALLFEHAIHHKGEPVTRGRKYVLRSDVMYSADSEDADFEDKEQGFETDEEFEW